MATVLTLVPYPFLPARVGGQRGVALFYKYFSRFYTVICVTTRNNEPRSAEGFEVRNILSPSPLRYINPLLFFRMRRLIRQEKVTHLILEHPYYGWLGVLLKWTSPVRLVIHSHNLEGLRWKNLGKWWWRILWAYEKWAHRRADMSFFIHDGDREYAIKRFGLRASRCITATYGFEKQGPPSPDERKRSRHEIRERHGIQPEERLLFFNGAFNYAPNLQALEYLVTKVNPLLRKRGLSYKILVCGKDIPPALQNGRHPNLLFAGFVPDIQSYFQGADLFLNPVVDGGGIKTKLVEALGNNLTAVSVANGAEGVDPAWCNGKLLVCGNGDWEGFADLIQAGLQIEAEIPPVYFEHFYWGNIARRAAEALTGM
jgi:glycosyltransferase involved in cell wall biosynthesis